MQKTLFDIAVNKIDGTAATLAEYRGQVLLMVNVASQCGLTPQYEALEKLHEDYRECGFAVLGFPANDFAAQEPGSNEEIATFCTSIYGVQFPMHAKIAVTGDDQHALYAHLTRAQPLTSDRATTEAMLRQYHIEPTAAPEVVWNFEKFLVGRDGQVIARYAPTTTPDAAELVAAIEKAIDSAIAAS